MDTNLDQITIDKVLRGDTNAFAYLIDKYKNMAYTVAIKIVKNEEDAEEVAQDSFLKAYQKLDSFKGDAKFSTWLYSIVYRNAISKIRKKKLVQPILILLYWRTIPLILNFLRLKQSKTESKKNMWLKQFVICLR